MVPWVARNCGILSWCGSDRHIYTALVAMFTHPCGSLGSCKIFPQVFAHTPALFLTLAWLATAEAWHLQRPPLLYPHQPFQYNRTSPLSLVLDQGTGFLMG